METNVYPELSYAEFALRRLICSYMINIWSLMSTQIGDKCKKKKRDSCVSIVISQAAVAFSSSSLCHHSEHVTKCVQIAKADAPAITEVHPIH